jgi:hypothetical protein
MAQASANRRTQVNFSTLIKASLVAVTLAVAPAALLSGHAGAQSAGGVSITTDKSQYQAGDTDRVCYTVAGPGSLKITEVLPDGSSQLIFTDDQEDGTGGCVSATALGPNGTECLQVDATSGGSTGSAKTCFQVIGQVSPA